MRKIHSNFFSFYECFFSSFSWFNLTFIFLSNVVKVKKNRPASIFFSECARPRSPPVFFIVFSCVIILVHFSVHCVLSGVITRLWMGGFAEGNVSCLLNGSWVGRGGGKRGKGWRGKTNGGYGCGLVDSIVVVMWLDIIKDVVVSYLVQKGSTKGERHWT